MQRCGLAPDKRLRFVFGIAKIQSFCEGAKLFRKKLENIFHFIECGLVFTGKVRLEGAAEPHLLQRFLLASGQLVRHPDLELDIHVSVSAAITLHAGESLPAQFDHRAALRAGLYLYLIAAIQAGN